MYIQLSLWYPCLIIRHHEFECEEQKEDSVPEESIPRGSLVSVPSYLSTIVEGNSPYGTEYGGSRKSTYYPPTAASLFEQLSRQDEIQETTKSPSAISRYSNLTSEQSSNSGFIPTSESDSPYYPLGSEHSNRPTTPRFTIEEVSSAAYEPIIYPSPHGKYVKC